VGWGYDENLKLADSLQMAKLQVVSQKDCTESTNGIEVSSIHARSTTFCAGFQNGTNVRKHRFYI